MRRLLSFVAFLFGCLTNVFFAAAQVGFISLYAYSPADVNSIAVDRNGLAYATDGLHVYQVAAGGLAAIVAGGGSSYGDGGPATAAQFMSIANVSFDQNGNMFIADYSNGVIRKVNTAGIISTVAGNYALGVGYTGDGGPATAARIECHHVCVDHTGNLFIADDSHSVVRKVNSAGIITTVAGNGTFGYSGDGGPATAAQIAMSFLENITGMTTDLLGNLYISDNHDHVVRTVNAAAGTITTIAGGGITLWTDGMIATAASFSDCEGIAVDSVGNLYISGYGDDRVALVDTSGIVHAGVGAGVALGHGIEGVPAADASLFFPADVCIDKWGNIYVMEGLGGGGYSRPMLKIARNHLGSPIGTGNIRVDVNSFCNGPVFNVTAHSFTSTSVMTCYYGDGTFDTSTLTPVLGGVAVTSFTHSYTTAGNYSIKILETDGPATTDSLVFTYEYKLCNTLSSAYYYDANGNCTFDGGDNHIFKPLLAEVDSNGVAIDTISATSGIYYTAYGNPGDIYRFRIISSPGNMLPSCPASGTITDTLQSVEYNTRLQDVGFNCTSAPGYDLELNTAMLATGVNGQEGYIFVSNTRCGPKDATVTLHCSDHYLTGMTDITPYPLFHTDSTITWSLSGLSNDQPPATLFYRLPVNPDSGVVAGYLVRSYYSVGPVMGDLDLSNNTQTRIDTVKAGTDPNEMDVTPAGIISAGTQLRYTITFTNTGNDTTYNVYVMDTLSDNVDISSLRMVMCNANMNIAKMKNGNQNIIKFDFPNIYLLDSVDHPHDCSRSLIFTINAKAGLPDGTTIFNHAGIFFDYNPVVLTNTVEDVIGTLPSSVNSIAARNAIHCYPNPANTLLNVDNVQASSPYTLINVIGDLLQKGALQPGGNHIDVHDLPQGTYFLKINSNAYKFVKL